MCQFRIILILSLILSVGRAAQAEGLTFNGSASGVWSEKGAAATGLDYIYVARTLSSVTATYTAKSAGASVTVEKWGANGAAYGVPLQQTDFSRRGATVTLSNLQGDTGYTITEDGRASYFWIIDYSRYPFAANGLTPSDESDCDRTILNFAGSATPIMYHGINARSWTLSRELQLSYTTQTFSEDNFDFIPTEHSVTLESVETRINVEEPLCDTRFTLRGDRFLKFWGAEKEISSDIIPVNAIAAEARATQSGDTPDNQITADTDGLGGSAPVEITFAAAISEGVLFHEWQFSPFEDFSDITMRTQQTEFTRTFLETGTTYARFAVANGDGSCTADSPTFTISIGESFLRCPNAFSPYGSEGVNDEWRVSYKSITSFECYIFNRWGEKLCEFRDPSKGWDGRHKGKIVPAGVYYYVIKAKGSDGKNYDLAGDINIVKYTGVK